MMTLIERNMKLQEDLQIAKNENDTRMVYALSIVMGLDPEEQLYDTIIVQRKIMKKLEESGWAEVSPA